MRVVDFGHNIHQLRKVAGISDGSKARTKLVVTFYNGHIGNKLQIRTGLFVKNNFGKCEQFKKSAPQFLLPAHAFGHSADLPELFGKKCHNEGTRTQRLRLDHKCFCFLNRHVSPVNGEARCRMSEVRNQRSEIGSRTTVIELPGPAFLDLSSDIGHPTSDLCLPTSYFLLLPFYFLLLTGSLQNGPSAAIFP